MSSHSTKVNNGLKSVISESQLKIKKSHQMRVAKVKLIENKTVFRGYVTCVRNKT